LFLNVSLKPLAKKRTVALVVLVIVTTAGGAAFLFARFFLIWASHVPTGAMKNTIIPGDHILSFKLFGQPERGSVVIFRYPPSERDTEDTYYVARIVGLPDETIQLRDHTVYINEKPLDEVKVLVNEPVMQEPLSVVSTDGNGPYQVFYMETPYDTMDDAPFGTTTPFRIPPDHYFLLGDNRDNSEDSRYRGPVPRNLIWGQSSLIYLSVSMTTGEIRSERAFKRIE
jgi:signal peptidase I